ncbi:hypothetical protein ElyMa_004192600 [Elysia marginata]|uniref:Uncharacterized protein n=1 Tax=Elysia marginata TaxID=1093978 RepID=A0AAV4GKB4_9GAST|nr:hypothetical protein ElyMa_004192600 [Elysia marginata]
MLLAVLWGWMGYLKYYRFEVTAYVINHFNATRAYNSRFFARSSLTIALPGADLVERGNVRDHMFISDTFCHGVEGWGVCGLPAHPGKRSDRIGVETLKLAGISSATEGVLIERRQVEIPILRVCLEFGPRALFLIRHKNLFMPRFTFNSL